MRLSKVHTSRGLVLIPWDNAVKPQHCAWDTSQAYHVLICPLSKNMNGFFLLRVLLIVGVGWGHTEEGGENESTRGA